MHLFNYCDFFFSFSLKMAHASHFLFLPSAAALPPVSLFVYAAVMGKYISLRVTSAQGVPAARPTLGAWPPSTACWFTWETTPPWSWRYKCKQLGGQIAIFSAFIERSCQSWPRATSYSLQNATTHRCPRDMNFRSSCFRTVQAVRLDTPDQSMFFFTIFLHYGTKLTASKQWNNTELCRKQSLGGVLTRMWSLVGIMQNRSPVLSLSL